MTDEELYDFARTDLLTFYYATQGEVIGDRFCVGEFDKQLLSSLQFDFFKEQLDNNFPLFTYEASVQHGKSVKIQTFLAWWLGLMGSTGQYFANYYTSSEDLAVEFDQRFEKLFNTEAFRNIFGTVFHPRRYFFKFGQATLTIRLSNAGNTGYPSHLTVVDDPYSNHKEAVSPTLRENAWLSCTANLLGRINNNAGAIFIHSRWHTDDIIGRIKKKPFTGWVIKSYKWSAIKPNGQPLFPEIMPMKVLLAKKGSMPDWAFQAQMMQEPFNMLGNVIPVKKINIIEQLPENIEFNEIFIVADTAYSIKKSADDSAIAVMGITETDIYLLDMAKGKWNFTTLCKKIDEQIDVARAFGRFNGVYIENKASGQSLIQVLRENTNCNYEITELYPNTTSFIDGSKTVSDKLTRYYEIATIIEKGLFNVLNGDWVADFIEQCASFTGNGKTHDDMIDAGLIYPLKLAKDNQMINWAEASNDVRRESVMSEENSMFNSIYDELYSDSISEALFINEKNDWGF